METGMITSSTATAAATTSATTPSNTLGKDSFMKLLVAQLKNQDPTSASSQDPTAMVQQMTSFSALEQAQNTNTLLTGLQNQTSGLFQAQAAAMVGKTVQVNGSAFNLASGSASLGLNLATAANVTLTVKAANGQNVGLIPVGQLGAGDHTLAWDGKDANGVPLPDGTYSVTVSATTASGAAATATTTELVKVDSISFKNGAVYLNSGTNTFALTDVTKINA